MRMRYRKPYDTCLPLRPPRPDFRTRSRVTGLWESRRTREVWAVTLGPRSLRGTEWTQGL